MCFGVSPLVPVGVDMVYPATSVTRGRGVAKHSGRLELTWTDKDEAVLPTGDGRYGYTFVDPSDYRVSEVRLFQEVSRHGAEISEDFEPTKRVNGPVEGEDEQGDHVRRSDRQAQSGGSLGTTR